MDYQMAMSRRPTVGVERKMSLVWTRLVREVCVQTVGLELYPTLKQTESISKWQRSNQSPQEWQ